MQLIVFKAIIFHFFAYIANMEVENDEKSFPESQHMREQERRLLQE